MSGQLESRHFFREHDRVQHRDGRHGIVTDGHTLFAVVDWEDGERQELDQFDPAVTVLERAVGE